MPKLTDTQLVILSAAVQRDGGAVLPLPKRLKINAGTLTGVLKSLIRKGLVDERPAPPDAPAWRETDDGQRFMLTVSSAGFEAIGIERAPHESATAAAERNSTRKPARQKPTNGKKATASSKRSGSKQDIIIGLLQRPKGATVPDLQAATGWQPHSVRAALTGWRKKGHEIVRTHGNGGATQYRIIDNQNAD